MSSLQGKQKATQQARLVGCTLHNGEYTIEMALGQGGMGQVFLAVHTTLQISLAIKQARADQPIPGIVITELDRILHGEYIVTRSSKHRVTENDFPTSGGIHTDRFLREALLLARLQHPCIPALYDYFFEDGYWYLVMDYIPGPTLASYLHQHAPLPPLEALNYAMQLCNVLDYLHRQAPPVIFRDLKPSNIILCHDGRLMVVDFGIARYFKAGQMNDTTELGSPGYAPPEQYQGAGQTDGRSDLFSLGVILHEMLSGQRPVGTGRKLDSLHYLNHALSPVLSGLVSVATRSEPMYRFQSAHTFYLALERVYRVEERRSYQERIRKVEETLQSGANEQSQETRPQAPTQMLLSDETSHISQPASTPLTQRLHTREALQEARRERLEQDTIELHLESVDESLQRRSSMGIMPTPLPPVKDQQEILLSSGFPFIARRIIQACFVLALIIFLVMASLLVYVHYFQHTRTNFLSQQVQITPTSTAAQSSSWQVLPSLPSPEADNTAVYIQVQGRTYIYMTGGYRGHKTSPHYDRNLYRYDIAAAHWETLTNGNFPGMVNNAGVQDEQHHLFFTVGYSPDLYATPSLLYMYQPADGTLQKIVPPVQIPIGFGAAMVADQHGHLYISQGFMQAGDSHVLAGTGWYRYDIASGQWHTLAPLPLGLGYSVLAPDNAAGIFLLGGSTDAGQHSTTRQIYRYDIAQNVWTLEQASSPMTFSGAASCLNGSDQLVIVGGYDAERDTSFNQAWLLDLHTLHWVRLASLPAGGSLLGTAACDGAGHVFLVRGANDPNRPTLDFWELTIGTH